MPIYSIPPTSHLTSIRLSIHSAIFPSSPASYLPPPSSFLLTLPIYIHSLSLSLQQPDCSVLSIFTACHVVCKGDVYNVPITAFSEKKKSQLLSVLYLPIHFNGRNDHLGISWKWQNVRTSHSWRLLFLAFCNLMNRGDEDMCVSFIGELIQQCIR